VSRERALRRAARQARAQAEQARRDRRAVRLARRRALVRRLTPRRRRTGRLYARRGLAERIAIGLAAVLAVAAVWWYFGDLSTRLALTALVVVAAPALVVLTFDRRT
jgi:hypothetical protein